ncbi:MAG: glycogen debranching protein [Prochlorothrix sp.]|nr:glycogen debranching protein [Prochlorothrix sp.]
MKTIWVNEQRDPSGILYSCIACTDPDQAQDCYQSFQDNLTADQKAQGWTVSQHTVSSWDEVPPTALKLN